MVVHQIIRCQIISQKKSRFNAGASAARLAGVVRCRIKAHTAIQKLSIAVTLLAASCDGLITSAGFDSFTASQEYDVSVSGQFLNVAAVCMESKHRKSKI